MKWNIPNSEMPNTHLQLRPDPAFIVRIRRDKRTFKVLMIPRPLFNMVLRHQNASGGLPPESVIRTKDRRLRGVLLNPWQI